MWAVIVEWRGHNPPSTFYRRLRLLTGASTRGNRVGPGGAIIQESVIIVPSRDLAEIVVEQIRRDAERHGWEDVDIKWAEIELERPVVPDRIRAVWAHLSAQYGRKGRAPADKLRWWITCLGCAAASAVELRSDYRPYLCPRCGSTRIRSVPQVCGGDLGPVPVPARAGLLEQWQAGRWYWGYFRIPLAVRPEENPEVLPRGFRDQTEKEILGKLLGSPLASRLESLEVATREQRLRFLDALFCSLVGFSPQERREARLRVIFDHYCSAGTTAETLPLVPPDEGGDALEAAPVLGREALVWMALLGAAG
ncbi:MAG: hypothetical protein ACP5OO_11250 [Chloroflexia bacterium]